MKKSLLFLLMLPMLAIAQKGVKFEHGSTWKEVLAKAKAENKYIFMDAFTTWCGPCRYMTANIFPQEKVGNFFNEKYVNLAVQLDTTKADNEEVKKWYKDAHDIMVDYKVNVFPTYLFFSPDGKLVHRAIGSSDAETFLVKANDALNPEKQYYTLLDKHKEGNKQPEFLRTLAYAALEAYDNKTAAAVSKEYLATQKDLFAKENIDFIDKFTQTSKDLGFAFILKNTAKFDEVRGQGAARTKLTEIVKRDEVYPVLFKRGAPDANWPALTTSIQSKYPDLAQEVISASKVVYFQQKQDWNNFQVAVQDYMKQYGAKASAAQLNDYAWTVFENCKDMTCVTDALEWSKRSFKDNNNPMFIDTYANILYKLGKKEEAITWEEKALALVGETDKKTYQETVDKMKKGEKTWKD
jgi:thioredoxin-related protein